MCNVICVYLCFKYVICYLWSFQGNVSIAVGTIRKAALLRYLYPHQGFLVSLGFPGLLVMVLPVCVNTVRCREK